MLLAQRHWLFRRARSLTGVVRAVTAAVVAVALLLPAAAQPALADQAASQPEAHALDLINQARAAEGRVALLWDSRLADIAQWRSDTQATNGVMAHLSSWDPILDAMDAKGIVYYGYGEVLVRGTPQLTPMESAKQAVDTWHASAAHWDWLSSPDFNYIALGMARGTDGWYYWTALLLKGPDRTPPITRMTGSQLGGMVDGKRQVSVSWTGQDVRLSVLTAGLRDFKLQKRIGSGRWVRVTKWTTATSRSLQLRIGRTYSFRVRARDAAGNRSDWSVILRVEL